MGGILDIRELLEAMAKAMRSQAPFYWDSSKPYYGMKGQMDVGRLAALVWRALIPLAEKQDSTFAW